MDLARPADQDMYLTQLPSYEYRYLVGYLLVSFFSFFRFSFSLLRISRIWYTLRRLDRVRLFLYVLLCSLFSSYYCNSFIRILIFLSFSLSLMNHRFFISFRAACRAASVSRDISFYFLSYIYFSFLYSNFRRISLLVAMRQRAHSLLESAVA